LSGFAPALMPLATTCRVARAASDGRFRTPCQPTMNETVQPSYGGSGNCCLSRRLHRHVNGRIHGGPGGFGLHHIKDTYGYHLQGNRGQRCGVAGVSDLHEHLGETLG